MTEQVLKINGVLYYSHHTSYKNPGVWYKCYKKHHYRFVHNSWLTRIEKEHSLAHDGHTMEIVPNVKFRNFVKLENVPPSGNPAQLLLPETATNP